MDGILNRIPSDSFPSRKRGGSILKKEIEFAWALPAFLILLAAMVLCCIVWKISPHWPLLFGCLLASGVALRHGYRGAELLGFAWKGVRQSLEALAILLLIGVLMAVWIASGTVPAMMYYAMKIVLPRFFFVFVFLVCAAASMALGSWGTAGTVGLAMLGVGNALGLPAALTAGAVVSGAYVGDKASPLTDCLNLTAAVSGCGVRMIARDLLRTLWKVLLVTALAYLTAGLLFRTGESGADACPAFLEGLQTGFRISPLLLLPFVLMLGCGACGLSAIPSIAVGIVSGGILAVAMQRCPLTEVLSGLWSGYLCRTGNAELDRILTGGGIRSMLSTVSLAAVAVAFGGIVTGTEGAKPLIAPLRSRVKTPAGMLLLTVVTAVCVNALLPDQYLSIALCGQLYASCYAEKGVKDTLFANAVSAGAITSPLVPWNSCGMYMTSVLGVASAQYLPFAWFNLLMPLAILIRGAGISRRKNGAADRLA